MSNLNCEVREYLEAKLGVYVKVESVKEVNYLNDPPITEIRVEGFTKINGIFLEFKTGLSPSDLGKG